MNVLLVVQVLMLAKTFIRNEGRKDERTKERTKGRLYLSPKQSCNTEQSNVPKTNVILNHMVPKIALIYSFKLTIQFFFSTLNTKKI